MVKKIPASVLQQLGQTLKDTAGEVIKETGRVAQTAEGQVVAKPTPSREQEQLQVTPQNPQEQAKKEVKKTRTLTALRTELAHLQQQKAQETPKQVTGKPGFSQERVIEQIKTEKERKNNLPPAVALAKKKGGSGERRTPPAG